MNRKRTFSILSTGCFCLFIAVPVATGENTPKPGAEVAQTAHDGVAPYGKQQNFSPWLKPGEFELWVKKISDKQYPIMIQGKPLVGDGVAYRALLMDKPANGLQSEFVYGVKESEFDQRHEKLRQTGYVLVQHQVVQLFGFKSHQAVWVKSIRELPSAVPDPNGKPRDFSRWLHPGDFELWVGKISDKQYPIVIQGGALVGDGVVYRALLVDKPTKDLQSEFSFGAKESEFKQRHEELNQKGYVLIQHQTVQLFGFIAHQAVWVNSN